MKWSYARPPFEYTQGGIDVLNSWIGHKNFAYDLVSAIKPKKVVELGTHYGTSFFSMCQAVKDRGLSTELFAVDTWKGDYQAGYYTEEVFDTVQTLVSKYYRDLSIHLVRKTFDEAVHAFADKSIDILHIDGLHTYDAVKHDFDTWISKMAPQGIMLFHDIHTRQGDFGVYILWEELKKQYPTMEFYHSYGLGILFLDPRMRDEFLPFEMIWQRYYSLLDDYTRYTESTATLSDQIKEKEKIIAAISETAKELENEKERLVSRVGIAEQKNEILGETVGQRLQTLQDLQSKIQSLEGEKKALTDQQKNFFDQYAIIQKELVAHVGILNEKDMLLRQKEEEHKTEMDRLAEKHKETVSAQDAQLSLLQENVHHREQQQILFVQKAEQSIGELQAHVTFLDTVIAEKNKDLLFVQSSTFWKLRDFILRSKWALFHPFSFLKKYFKKVLFALIGKSSKVAYLLEQTALAFRRDGFWIMTVRIKNYIVHGKGRILIKKESDERLFHAEWKNIVHLRDKKIPLVAAKKKPLVSIIIPVHNQIPYTLQCLKSIAYTAKETEFEVIVVNDASTDDTHKILSRRSDIVYLRNKENKGFVGSCNYGAGEAKGEYLFFLNNDTIVLDRWLDTSVRLAVADPSIGLVGSKLIFEDGTLQEAGGIIWSDGSGYNYGRGENPEDSKYNFVRDVDYCSGAAILVRKDLFQKIGGFDVRYAPAYYEDVDLAFSVRKLGFRTLYNPFSEVIHFEGVTSGTDVTKGVKSYQVRNQEIFLKKRKNELAAYGMQGEKSIDRFSRRRATKSILIIDQITLTPDQDAGSLYMANMIQILSDFGFHVTFIPCANLAYVPGYTEFMQRLGVECMYPPYISSVTGFLKDRGLEYDYVMLTRIPTGEQYINDVTEFCPQAKIIFNTIDVHYLRLLRQAEQEKSSYLREQAEQLQVIEIGLMKKSHRTIVVSSVEKEIIGKSHPDIPVDVVHLILDDSKYAKRENTPRTHDVLFIGGFNHTPNMDAVLWFYAEIFPLVKKVIPDARFHIVGSNMPQTVKDLASESVVVHGYVTDPQEIMQQSRITIAPLRFGAGQKGKIIQSLAFGVPCVTTSIGAEGIPAVYGKDLLVVDTREEFAQAVIRLLENDALCDALSKNGYEMVKSKFSMRYAREALKKLFQNFKKGTVSTTMIASKKLLRGK